MKEGWWLSAKTGRYYEIDEHSYWISEPTNSKKMGLSASAIKLIGRLNPQIDRVRILKIAMNEGLIRVRWHGVSVSFEFTVPTVLAMKAIIRFGRKIGIGKLTHIYFANLLTGQSGNMIGLSGRTLIS